MHARVNNFESCICCNRRSDGLAVGKPGKLGWYCDQCTPDLARIALQMALSKAKELDSLEKLAAEKVADLIGGDATIPANELPAFVAWAVKEFAEAMRKHLESGAAPF